MNRKILLALGIVGALVFGAAATDANAVCPLAKQFAQAFIGPNNYRLIFPADADKSLTGGVLKGRWWQSGARSAHNEGVGTATPCNEDAWMVDNGSGGADYIYGFMAGSFGQGTCEGVGCPAGPLVALVQTTDTAGTKSYYAVGKANGIDSWDFSAGSATDWNLVEVPRPRVTGSARSGLTVTVNLSYDAPIGARGESDNFAPESILTGYQLVRFEGAADPGRDPASWTNLGAAVTSTSGGATATGIGVLCTGGAGTPNDAFIATRLIFDGGQYSGDYVSASTRIECDPNLADPRFKLIDKKKPTRATIQPN